MREGRHLIEMLFVVRRILYNFPLLECIAREKIMSHTVPSLAERIASDLSVRVNQVDATIEMLDEGATVPFIARYRKERTGGLDDVQLRALAEKLVYLRELDDRRDTILTSINEQGKLTPDLERDIMQADAKTRLEDLYLPYKPKRRTKAQVAKEAGLEPLAVRLLQKPFLDPETEARKFIKPDKGVADAEAALEGARYIMIEHFAENADLLATLRDYIDRRGFVKGTVAKGKENEGAKYRDYFDYSEPIKRIPSHRMLALLRGFKEDILKIDIVPDRATLEGEKNPFCETLIARHFRIADRGRPADAWLQKSVSLTWKGKIHPHLKTEFISKLRESAEQEAIKVFANNLKDLLMAAPAGPKATLGLDPGLRTGVKVAVLDDTGKLVATDTIYPHAPKKQWSQSIDKLQRLCKRFEVKLIAIGNGTASRETDKLAGELIKDNPELDMKKITVSEAGASVYSASELAAAEFPDLDVSLRGAVSIARRLQDPLAELVKIDPKSIGVGQYQHDVNQTRLAGSLDAVVEDCVNGVGVDLNMASAPLLTRVSGLNTTLAKNIVAWRNEHGRFSRRQQLKDVPRLGPRAFEQAAGFLRVMGGAEPLDASAVHPEAYQVVSRISKKSGKSVAQLIGATDILKTLNAADYTDDRFGLPTVTDILAELDKPGRDPRGQFETAEFREGVEKIEDLEIDMVLQGVVSNVTNFGAFVDVGVHQDGLVHISQLANHFVSDPRAVVKAGDMVKVRVTDIDVPRKRISLTMKDV